MSHEGESRSYRKLSDPGTLSQLDPLLREFVRRASYYQPRKSVTFELTGRDEPLNISHENLVTVTEEMSGN